MAAVPNLHYQLELVQEPLAEEGIITNICNGFLVNLYTKLEFAPDRSCSLALPHGHGKKGDGAGKLLLAFAPLS